MPQEKEILTVFVTYTVLACFKLSTDKTVYLDTKGDLPSNPQTLVLELKEGETIELVGGTIDMFLRFQGESFRMTSSLIQEVTRLISNKLIQPVVE